MAVPVTPAEWLAVLARRMDKRVTSLVGLQRYLDGDPPLPEGATADREAFRKWQSLAKTDFANLIVDAPAERMTISGFRVGDDAADNDAARTLWERSEMDAGSADIHRAMLGLGVSYGMASPGPDGAVLTAESPLSCITDHNPLVPSVVRAMLKTWVDETDDVEYAVVHVPGAVQKFRRAPNTGLALSLGNWEPVGDPQATGLPVVPGVRFLNRDGRGEFALHTDLLDRINWVILQRLLIIAMQAFKQRAISGELPSHDAAGNEINWGEVFTPGPDALWTLPEGVTIWESTPGSIEQILSAVKDDIRDLSAVTRTPMSVLSPDSANQSAEGAALMREGLIYKVEDRIKRVSPAWNNLVSIGLRLDGLVSPVAVQWAPAERQSLAEKSDAAVKLATVLPWRRVASDVMGYPADEVDRMEVERTSDALTAMMAAPAVVAPVTNGQG